MTVETVVEGVSGIYALLFVLAFLIGLRFLSSFSNKLTNLGILVMMLFMIYRLTILFS